MLLDCDIETSAKMAALVQHITQARKPDSYASALAFLSLKWHEAVIATIKDFFVNDETETIRDLLLKRAFLVVAGNSKTVLQLPRSSVTVQKIISNVSSAVPY